MDSRICVCVFALALMLGALRADELEQVAPSQLSPISQSLSNTTQPLPNPYLYEPTSRAGYLATSTGLILGGTLIGAGVLYMLPESVTNWNKDDIVNLGKNWSRKTARGPVIDGDDWFLNWITHPYWGAVYYMQPRRAGYSWAESALFSVLASALFWEYGIEAFAETPSWQDLVITPAIGSIIGELFYQATLHIHANENRVLGSKFLGKTSLLLMDPIGIILQDFGLASALGVKNKNEIQGYIAPISGRSGNGVQLMLIARF